MKTAFTVAAIFAVAFCTAQAGTRVVARLDRIATALERQTAAMQRQTDALSPPPAGDSQDSTSTPSFGTRDPAEIRPARCDEAGRPLPPTRRRPSPRSLANFPEAL